MKTPVTKIWFGLSALTLLITAWQVSVHWERPREATLGKSASDKEMGAEEASSIPVDPASVTGPAQNHRVAGSTERNPLLKRDGQVRGEPARSIPEGINPQTIKGRTVILKQANMAQWAKLQEGSKVTLPSFDETSYEGTIALRVEDNGWLRFGGSLGGGRGTFSLHIQSGQLAGNILLPAQGIGLELRTEPSGEVILVERKLSNLLCWPILPVDPDVAAAQGDGIAVSSGSGAIPQINTRPGAKGLIYLHFAGGTIVDTDWNGGKPIEAAPSTLSADGIREVVARVAEDYAPFDMAVSTVLADYENSRPGSRMRVIITPTNVLQQGAGGLSLIGSWRYAGMVRTSTVPAWVFNSSAKTIAEAASHEVGHTLGLNHDGTLYPAHHIYENGVDVLIPAAPAAPYYLGNGTEGSPTNWAPIMGNSYTRPLTQWSKGEYLNANNTEDDLAIISAVKNGVGYGSNTPDSTTDASGTFRLLKVEAGTFVASGVLRRVGMPDLQQADVPDRFQFSTTGGSLVVSAKPLSPAYTNVDIQLELHKQSGAPGQFSLMSTANPPELLASVLRAQGLPSGTYQIVVRPAASTETDTKIYLSGYSSYGSLGPYQITGTLENADPLPAIVSPLFLNGYVGTPINFALALTPETNVLGVSGSLPPGLTWNQEIKRLQGTPTQEGFYETSFVLQSRSGTLSRPLKLWVDPPSLPIPEISGVLGVLVNSPTAPWTGQLLSSDSGAPIRAAVSGRIANGGTSRLRLRIPAKRTVSFWWKTSSEAGHDVLECRLNGLLARDMDSGEPLKISGETGWIRRRIRLDSSAAGTLDFHYTKDTSLSEGEDRGWITGVEIGMLPVLKKSPASIRLKPADTALNLSALVENATSYQWKKEGVALVDSVSGGREVSGATTPNLLIKGVTGADSGGYTLSATNEFDTVITRKADVIVPSAPIILQTVSPTAPVHAGETLLLGVDAVGAKPFTTSWRKNGVLVRRVSGTVLPLKNATPATAGTYSVTVSNSFGISAPKEITAEVIPAR